MKRIFLSLGFRGRSEKDIMKDIYKAEEIITLSYPDEDIEFVHNYDYVGNNSVECLGEAIKKMSTCDEVYFINNWVDHKGCRIENKVCILYAIPYKEINT